VYPTLTLRARRAR